MTAFPFDAIAFDLDGTLADTLPDIAAGLNRMLADLGREGLAPAHVRSLIGGGGKSLVRKVLAAGGAADDALLDRAYALYLDHYAAHICEGTRPYPGAERAMDDLAGRNVRLALCTNKSERMTFALVDALGWRPRFAAIVCGDTLAVHKPDPAPLREAVARAGGGRAALVGDSIIDAGTARAAALPFVAVSFGYADRPVSELGADAVIGDYADLVATLEQLPHA